MFLEREKTDRKYRYNNQEQVQMQGTRKLALTSVCLVGRHRVALYRETE